ncbi:retrovirus-related pol polyprotein from transposon TNT 1-94 [Tanacetum coccineum]
MTICQGSVWESIGQSTVAGLGETDKECRKQSGLKNTGYQRRRCMMCKQAGTRCSNSSLSIADWLEETELKRLYDVNRMEDITVHGKISGNWSHCGIKFYDTPLMIAMVIPDSSNICTNDNQVDQIADLNVLMRVLALSIQDHPHVYADPYAQRIMIPYATSDPAKTDFAPMGRHNQQLKSYQVERKGRAKHLVKVKFPKKELVEDQHRMWKMWFNSNHDACVSRYLKDGMLETKSLPFASDTIFRNPRVNYKKLYENTNQEWKWWIAKRCPSDLNQGNVTIKRVYYVEGLNHNLFSVGQFCDADLEVAFRKSTCFVRDLQGNDLLTGNRGSDLYTISLQETTSSTPICFMAKASPTQAWLWHRRLSHLNFDYITLLSKKDIVTGLPKLTYVKDQLCSSCEMSKAKRSSFKSKAVPSSKGRLNLLHMDLCGPMRVASINGKKYILVIVDDYSRYTWTLFLRSKDETPEVLKDFLTMIQRNLQAQVISVRTDRGTEFLNKTLHAYFKEEGIEHQTSTPRTPEQNGVVERRNRTLVEAARTMLSASKLPLSFWAEAVATACYTQNRSIIISTHGKTAYHIINDRKPSIKHLHIFGCICYITRDGENLDKMKEKGDPCVMVGYSTQSKGYRVYNKRTRLIVESIHIKFDEIKEMMSDHNSSDLAPQRQEIQNVVPTAEKTDSSQQGLEFLFSPLLEEYYNLAHGHAEDNNNDQAPNASFQEAKFINPFCTRVQEIGESSSRNIDNTDVHSFQPQSHDYRWTRDHPLEQVRGNPTMPVQTR